MRYIKLGLDLFNKRLLINLLLVIQVVIALTATNFAFARTQSIRMSLSIIEKIPNPNTVCTMAFREIIELRGDNYLDLEGIQGDYEVGSSSIFFLSSDTFPNLKAQAYDNCLIENIPVPLSRGSWEMQPITENGTVYYPVVINAAYSNLGYGDKMSVWATMHKESGDETIPFSIYVAGILNSDQRYISLGSGSNVATSDNFFQKQTGSRSSPLLFFNKELLPTELEPLFSVQSTRFLFFDRTIDQTTMEQNIAILSNQAYTFTLNEILENSEAEYNDNMRFYMPFCVCIYAIALIGIISFVALNTLQNAHYFSILYLCGCRWKNCLYICTGYIGVITVLSLLLSFFIYSVASFAGITEQMGLYFTTGNLWLTLAIIAVLVITSLIIPFVMIHRFSVTEFIRKYEK